MENKNPVQALAQVMSGSGSGAGFGFGLGLVLSNGFLILAERADMVLGRNDSAKRHEARAGKVR